jgi:hypothetical protein
MTKKQLNINKATTVRTISVNDIAKLAYIKSMTSGKSAKENWYAAENELQTEKELKDK